VKVCAVARMAVAYCCVVVVGGGGQWEMVVVLLKKGGESQIVCFGMLVRGRSPSLVLLC
jgi:hypothetical protein